jgi:hypothetical protein
VGPTVPHRTHWSVMVKIGCKVDGMAKLSSGGQTSGKTEHIVSLWAKLSSVQTSGMVVKNSTIYCDIAYSVSFFYTVYVQT